MATVDVELDTRNIDRLIAQLPEECSAIVRGVALQVEAWAKLGAPVDTGYLRNSILTRVVNAFEAHVIVGALYGFFVEFGTVFTAAQPFLTPAASRGRELMQQIWTRLMERYR